MRKIYKIRVTKILFLFVWKKKVSYFVEICRDRVVYLWVRRKWFRLINLFCRHESCNLYRNREREKKKLLKGLERERECVFHTQSTELTITELNSHNNKTLLFKNKTKKQTQPQLFDLGSNCKGLRFGFKERVHFFFFWEKNNYHLKMGLFIFY